MLGTPREPIGDHREANEHESAPKFPQIAPKHHYTKIRVLTPNYVKIRVLHYVKLREITRNYVKIRVHYVEPAFWGVKNQVFGVSWFSWIFPWSAKGISKICSKPWELLGDAARPWKLIRILGSSGEPLAALGKANSHESAPKFP